MRGYLSVGRTRKLRHMNKLGLIESDRVVPARRKQSPRPLRAPTRMRLRIVNHRPMRGAYWCDMLHPLPITEPAFAQQRARATQRGKADPLSGY